MAVARAVHGRHHANRGRWGPAPRLLPKLLLHGAHLQLRITCSTPSMLEVLLAVAVAAEGDSWQGTHPAAKLNAARLNFEPAQLHHTACRTGLTHGLTDLLRFKDLQQLLHRQRAHDA